MAHVYCVGLVSEGQTDSTTSHTLTIPLRARVPSSGDRRQTLKYPVPRADEADS